MKTQIWVTLLAVILSNALVLMIHEMVYNRRSEKKSKDVQFLMNECERLSERITDANNEIKKVEDGIKKIDTIYFTTEKNYYIRIKDREKIPDSLLSKEWKKFGY